jgi:hypothetical protein
VGTGAQTGPCAPTPPTTPPTLGPTGPNLPPSIPVGLGGGFAGLPRDGFGSIPIDGAGPPVDGGGGAGSGRDGEDDDELDPVVEIGATDAPSPVGVSLAIVALAVLGAAGGAVSRRGRPGP